MARESAVFFKQFYLDYLSHASYMIGSYGEAAVVDPQRDVSEYLDEAGAHGLKIKYVIETHLHADFVSGHRELALRSGARIVLGHRARPSFDHQSVRDGNILILGKARLTVVETPGHTPESICVLVTDTENAEQPRRILTGDTLAVGDVGRPDLLNTRTYDGIALAGMLYDSLHGKLMALDDEVEVFPAHGSGRLSSTIGEQRRENPFVRLMARNAFIRMVTSGLPDAPPYFLRDAEINRKGARPMGDLTLQALPPQEVEGRMRAGHQILDVRPYARYAEGHVHGSIVMSLDARFATTAGSVLSPKVPLILVAEDADRAREALGRLARVGLESVVGFLAGGIEGWREAGVGKTSTALMIDVLSLRRRLRANSRLQLLDVRTPAEFAAGHITGAVNVPLASLEEQASQLNAALPTAVVCANGSRSATAVSLLTRAGFRRVVNVVGGLETWGMQGFPVESEGVGASS